MHTHAYLVLRLVDAPSRHRHHVQTVQRPMRSVVHAPRASPRRVVAVVVIEQRVIVPRYGVHEYE